MPQVPAEFDRPVAYFVALVFGVVLLLGVSSALVGRVRHFLFSRVLGGIVLMATEQKRQEEQRGLLAAAKDKRDGERRERLRSAVGILAEGLATLNRQTSGVKIAQAIAELRTEGPSGLGPFLDAVAAAASDGGPRHDYELQASEVDALMRPIINRLVGVIGRD